MIATISPADTDSIKAFMKIVSTKTSTHRAEQKHNAKAPIHRNLRLTIKIILKKRPETLFQVFLAEKEGFEPSLRVSTLLP